MSEQQSAQQNSETVSDETQNTEPVTPELGDAGKRALDALRSENKELKSRIKALESANGDQRDAESSDVAPSDGARDAATDVDGERVATTADNVKPTRPRFEGTGDGGAQRSAPAFKPQLGRNDLAGMSPTQIDAARRNGQLRDLLRGK